MEVRKKEFIKEVKDFGRGIHSTSHMCTFIDYYTKIEGDGVMRFETYKNWDTRSKLAEWKKPKDAPYYNRHKNSPDVERILNEDYGDKKYITPEAAKVDKNNPDGIGT